MPVGMADGGNTARSLTNGCRYSIVEMTLNGLLDAVHSVGTIQNGSHLRDCFNEIQQYISIKAKWSTYAAFTMVTPSCHISNIGLDQ